MQGAHAPYTHRVKNVGSTPFHVMDIELLGENEPSKHWAFSGERESNRRCLHTWRQDALCPCLYLGSILHPATQSELRVAQQHHRNCPL